MYCKTFFTNVTTVKNVVRFLLLTKPLMLTCKHKHISLKRKIGEFPDYVEVVVWICMKQP